MTLIVIVAFCLIVFIGLLRYDIHKHKYRESAAEKKLPDDQHDTPPKS